jgi:hypothetical protein
VGEKTAVVDVVRLGLNGVGRTDRTRLASAVVTAGVIIAISVNQPKPQ